ncbi:polyprenol phosphomannose-dependent alpha 1,6 mannosyltransferase MptB [Krasilnikovia sp. MM14-A1259]|uniref:polyprenol phosphomannose-dependent alpha 1,6 mannosyltransferase MptB n=1 Tax=Krasilnikovia sp. MM14-A1259 TaxID=3373539 RepID=UPI003821F55A
MLRARLVRYGGLVGSVLLAVTAYLGGATSPWHPTMTPRTVFAGADGVLLPLTWLLGTVLLIAAWWLGRTAVPSLRWAYVTAGLWVLPLLPVLPLGSYDVHSYACQGWALATGHDPYAAGVRELGCPWTQAVAPTWRDSPAPYGPVFLVLAAGAARLGGSLAGTVAVLRALAVLGVALIGACLPVLARRHGVAPERAVWLVLACPLVVVHLVSGAHNDAVMVGLLVAGLAVAAAAAVPASPNSPDSPSGPDPLGGPDSPGGPDSLGGAALPSSAALPSGLPSPGGRAASRSGGPLGRAGLLAGAGVLLGLAIGVKVTAIVVLPFAVLAAVSVRAVSTTAGPQASGPGTAGAGDRRVPWRALWVPGAVIGAAAAGALAAVSFVTGLGFGWARNLADSGVSVQWTSPPTAVGLSVSTLARGFGAKVDAVPVTRLLGVAALAVVLVVLWWRARSGGALLGAGLALAATVALAPVFHPWYLTWPLAVLAATTRGAARWLAVPCAIAAALCLPDGYNLALATRAQGAFAVTALLVVILVVPWVRTRRRTAEPAGS